MSAKDISIDYELTALVPYYTDRIRTNTSFAAQLDYINTFYGDTFQEKAVWWAWKAGIDVDILNAFRAKMIDGSPATITYPTTLAITTQPQDVTADEGSSVTETIVAVGDGITYAWEYRTSSSGTWASISTLGLDATASSFTLPSVQTSINGYQVRCTVTDKYGESIVSGVATLTVASNAYSITYSLSNCTSSNTSTAVEEGGSYTTTITANSGYSLDSITVTMGGEDVTSSVVSGG